MFVFKWLTGAIVTRVAAPYADPMVTALRLIMEYDRKQAAWKRQFVRIQLPGPHSDRLICPGDSRYDLTKTSTE